MNRRHAGLGLQWRHPVLVLARDAQHLAARRQHAQLGRAPDQVRDPLGDGRQQLLEVVEDEQASIAPEVDAEGLADRVVGRLADPERPGDRGFELGSRP